jgi:dTDP-4-dehydrorhamnose reductase
MDGNRTGILIVGGSGYLGRFLIDHFARDPTCRVACTYHSNAPLLPVDLTNGDGSVSTHQVDLETGSGLRECLEKTKPRVICNCAAISQPALCEKDIHKATSINVPSKLVDAVLEMRLSRYASC